MRWTLRTAIGAAGVVTAIVALVWVARSASDDVNVDEIVECLRDRRPSLQVLSRAQQDLNPRLEPYRLQTAAVRFDSGTWATLIALDAAETADDAERALRALRQRERPERSRTEQNRGRADSVERRGRVVLGWNGTPSRAEAVAVEGCVHELRS